MNHVVYYSFSIEDTLKPLLPFPITKVKIHKRLFSVPVSLFYRKAAPIHQPMPRRFGIYLNNVAELIIARAKTEMDMFDCIPNILRAVKECIFLFSDSFIGKLAEVLGFDNYQSAN